MQYNRTTYKDLIVWQKSIDLVIVVYKLTDKYPKHELFGLTKEIRKSAVSIPSNIAEGKMRGTINEFRRFLLIAYGSGSELETQLEIGKRLNYTSLKDYISVDNLLGEVMKMLNSLISKQ